MCGCILSGVPRCGVAGGGRHGKYKLHCATPLALTPLPLTHCTPLARAAACPDAYPFLDLNNSFLHHDVGVFAVGTVLYATLKQLVMSC
jgi:hypothetical protein